ncbi:hypothetical protein [Actinoplanes sp. G11-F43]|uniref:hypothetical protein n=1 Tax=Actinoplanes sp. G11-F43 TaxID=3424130 RepID=UPI003D336E7C
MDRNLFTERLRQAAEAARQLAAPSLVEQLPQQLTLLVRFNMSYGERHFPSDDGRVERLPIDTAAHRLWRDGRVPEWIDVAVTSETGTATIVELTCCGRYASPGRTPFHVVGPVRPPADRRPFSIHHDFEVRDADSLHRLTEIAHQVRRLFIDTDLDVPVPAGVRLVRDTRCPHGSLAAYAGRPELSVLQIEAPGHFTLDGSPIPALTSLQIKGLPSRPWGMRALPTLAPSLVQLSLSAAGGLWAEGQIPITVREIELAGTHLVIGSSGTHPQPSPGHRPAPSAQPAPDPRPVPEPRPSSDDLAASPPFRLPPRLDSLGLHFSGGLPDLTPLDGLHQVKHLSLRGTPIAAALADTLITRLSPARVDLTHTRLGPTDLDRLESSHPGVELLPRRGPLPPSVYEGITIPLSQSLPQPPHII